MLLALLPLPPVMLLAMPKVQRKCGCRVSAGSTAAQRRTASGRNQPPGVRNWIACPFTLLGAGYDGVVNLGARASRSTRPLLRSLDWLDLVAKRLVQRRQARQRDIAGDGRGDNLDAVRPQIEQAAVDLKPFCAMPQLRRSW